MWKGFFSFLFVFCVFLGLVWGFMHVLGKPVSVRLNFSEKKESSEKIVSASETKTLFIPYWTTFSKVSQSYDQIIYFGVSPTNNGINRLDEGYLRIPEYVQLTPKSSTLLAVTMTNKLLNEKILESDSLQQKIIADTLEITKEYGFAGVVLDFEAGGIGFASQTKKVSHFITSFSEAVRKENISFDVVVYGDTFYRARPYDMKAIGSVSQKVFVMAYDFHKAGGDPGPNFPFAESNADDYTFGQMVKDFAKVVPKEKLVVVFGMFGYDWPISEKGNSIAQAKALSTNDIEASFVQSCPTNQCVSARNASREPSISYNDSENQQHVIWYEDATSVQKKIDFLHTQGIGAIGYWANGYF